MGNFKRYNLTLAILVVSALTLCVGYRLHRPRAHVWVARDLPAVRVSVRLVNGVNLTRPSDPRAFILKTVTKSLKARDRGQAFAIARAVITESNRHQIDPLLVLAVIKTESQFDPRARGEHGEIGLMQMMPATAQWLLRRPDPIKLEDPLVNIRVGTLYLAHLRERFPKHTSRFVAAYNMGAHNVRRLIASQNEPRIYAGRVLANYHDLNVGLRRQTLNQIRKIAARAL